MFYTITSRLPFILSDNTPRKLFKIFLIGSICYIILHYFLYLKVEGNILLKLRQYIYYIMGADFVLAYLLGKLWKSSNKYNNQDTQDNQDNIFNQKKALEEYEELKKLQMLRQMQMADSPFARKQESDKKVKTQTQSESHSKSSKKENKKMKEETEEKKETRNTRDTDDIADTTLPVYKK